MTSIVIRAQHRHLGPPGSLRSAGCPGHLTPALGAPSTGPTCQPVNQMGVAASVSRWYPSVRFHHPSVKNRVVFFLRTRDAPLLLSEVKRCCPVSRCCDRTLAGPTKPCIVPQFTECPSPTYPWLRGHTLCLSRLTVLEGSRAPTPRWSPRRVDHHINGTNIGVPLTNPSRRAIKPHVEPLPSPSPSPHRHCASPCFNLALAAGVTVEPTFARQSPQSYIVEPFKGPSHGGATSANNFFSATAPPVRDARRRHGVKPSSPSRQTWEPWRVVWPCLLPMSCDQ